MQQKILIVDDESLVADTLCIIFRKSGYECRVSYSGEQAIAAVQSFVPDLLICDVCMPDMDGLDVAEAISRVAPECRVLMFTGQYMNLRRVQAHFAEITTHSAIVTKPIQPEDLLRQARILLTQTEQKIAVL
jgi:CheY-like chemotaxis protein